MKSAIKYLPLSLAAGALFFTSACGKQDAASASSETTVVEVTIPDAPDEAMKTVFTELAKGNGGILWKAMPASYQTDMNEVVQLAGTKIDAEMYDQTFALIGRIGEVATKQKAFIVGTPLSQATPEQKAQLEKAVPMIAELVELITTSDLATSAGLQSFNGQAFFDTTVSQIAKLSIELSKLQNPDQPTLEDLQNAKFSAADVTDSEASVTVSYNDEVETERLTKVENRWVPVDMAAQWTQGIDDAKAQLEAMQPEEMTAMKPQLMNVVGMLDGVLTQLETAETQAQFDQALQGAMMPIMGLMMMGQGMGGGAPAMPMPTAP
jgi:hypothetical protein